MNRPISSFETQNHGVLTDPKADPAINHYEIDGELVLFDQRNARLFLLNSTAAFLWRNLVGGRNLPDICANLTEQTGVGELQARLDLNSMLRQWQREDLLLSNKHHYAPQWTASAKSKIASPMVALSTGSQADWMSEPGYFRGIYRVADFSFMLVGPAVAANAIDKIFQHLAVSAADADVDSTFNFELLASKGRWQLVSGKNVLGECADVEGLVPLVHAQVIAYALSHCDCHAGIHAAVVANDRSCVLLPAPPGGGKSTLAAAMMASGYGFCTDDLAILSNEPVRLRPTPVSLTLKSGSWHVLADMLPAIAALPNYQRLDGKIVKYLPPSQGNFARSPGTGLPVAAIVFPKYAPSGESELRPITRGQAFMRLTESGYEVPGGLDADWMRMTVQWLQDVPCYELPFSDVKKAVASVSTVFA